MSFCEAEPIVSVLAQLLKSNFQFLCFWERSFQRQQGNNQSRWVTPSPFPVDTVPTTILLAIHWIEILFLLKSLLEKNLISPRCMPWYSIKKMAWAYFLWLASRAVYWEESDRGSGKSELLLETPGGDWRAICHDPEDRVPSGETAAGGRIANSLRFYTQLSWPCDVSN